MDKNDLPTTTKRLCFRAWQVNDLPIANAIWGDAVVTELTGGPFTPLDVEKRLAQELKNWLQHGIQYWPVFQLRDEALIGCCGLRPRNSKARVAELGFQLCREAWGKGYASEAAQAVIEWARTHDFAALIAGHHPANHASKRALLRLGFSYTHNELYRPTGILEPCYRLPL